MAPRFLPFIGLSAVILLYLLTLATGSSNSLSEYFWWIIAAASVLILILLATVIRYIWFLTRAHRRKVLGSQIARRLAAMFTVVTVLPALFLFGVSAQFISYSINSWFGDDTDQALERSLSLSKSALNLAMDNSFGRAINLQAELFRYISRGNNPAVTLSNSQLAEQFDQLALYDQAENQLYNARNNANLPPPVLEQEAKE